MLIYDDKDRERFIKAVREVQLDKPYVAEFKPFRKRRTLPQNRLFWMWMRCIEDDTGNDVATLHDYFCNKYLGWWTQDCFGVDISKIKGTSDLDTKEFTVFLESIRMEMMNEQNIYLPQPGDNGWDEFYAKYGVG